MFQSVNLVPFLTAKENLTIVDELGKRTRKAAQRRADELLDELGLADRRRTCRRSCRADSVSGWRSDAR